MDNRELSLKVLLIPITWDWRTSVRQRQNIVIEARALVRNVYPFLNDDERKLADRWLETEKHIYLWE
jgi:hypothetical protein